MKTIQSRSPDFFLGATTPAGFKGYFEPLRREPGMQMLLIKSGPGCGKSTLMKHLAQAAEQQGQRIEKIHCASDPDSLDGVIFLDQKRAIIDATAPHVVEPDAPGADELVVSLYHTIDAGKLAPHRDEVKALFARNAALRGRAARYIASAGSLMLDSRGPRPAAPTLKRCAATSNGSAPGCFPAPRAPPVRSCGCSQPSPPRGWYSTGAR